MQDDQQADAQIANEPVPPASCATPPKKRGRLVTFFAKMYSPHGTLTCKEFVWPAVYLLTLGTIFGRMMLIPLEIINILSPLRDASFLGKTLVILYASIIEIIFFLYPLFTLCTKLLKNTVFRDRHPNIILFIILVFISAQMFVFERGSFLYYYSGYILCVALAFSVYIIGENFHTNKEDAAH